MILFLIVNECIYIVSFKYYLAVFLYQFQLILSSYLASGNTELALVHQ